MNGLSVSDYTILIRAFLDGTIDGPTFESRYLELFKSDPTRRPEPIFAALDRLFAAVDCYVSAPELRDPGDLDEEQLRAKAAETLRKLEMAGKDPGPQA
jgi:hypothetical protein